MSTNPELVNKLSSWLAGHVSDEELRAAVPEDTDLARALAGGAERAQLEPLVREAIEDAV